MRGIVLAGGTGSRLGDLTKVVNKHLLPVGGRPMIYWPLKVLRDNGIDDVTIVSTPLGVGQLAMLIGGGYNYRVQAKPGGIAQAIACADDRSNRSVAVILGDNVFLPSPRIKKDSTFSRCYLHESPNHDLTQFGVPRMVDGDIVEVVEKPKNPPSKYVVTGLYTFNCDVFGMIERIGAGARGEYEITDLLNKYVGSLRCTQFEGFWGDAGTHRGITECSEAIYSLDNPTSVEH